MSTDEVTYLHGQNCKVLLVYNGITGTTIGEGYDGGRADARNSIRAAQALGVPAGVVMVADIEDPNFPGAEWYQGWADAMQASPYAGSGGFYGNVNDTRFTDPYCAAAQADVNVQNALLWGDQPQIGCTSAAGAPTFDPAPAPCPMPITPDIWQYQDGPDTCFTLLPGATGMVDEDEPDSAAYAVMW